jgi:glucose/arabinose dehydrogenase
MPAVDRRHRAAVRRRGVIGLLAVAGLALTACGSTGVSSGNGPNWRPQPSFQGEGADPNAPSTASVAPPQPEPGGTGNGARGQDPAVVATRLTSPTAVAILPDNTALVGERTTGRIVRVQPIAGRPVRLVRTIHGLSTVGGGGLLDLALSPSYDEDNLIFAYLTTKTDNRVVAFTLHGPITPVLTGIPRGPRDNTGRIAFGPNGDLYVGTGDAGSPARAAQPDSLAGKILRITDIGRPAPGNPTPHSAVYARGLQIVNGLCIDSVSGAVLEVSPATDSRAAVRVVGPGADFGWPHAGAQARSPIAELPAAYSSPGGCAVSAGVFYASSLAGQAVLAAHLTLNRNGLKLGHYTIGLHHKYGRLRTVVAAPDGALWLTTSNRDGHGTPVPADERVLRIIPSGGGGGGGSPA